MDKKYIIDNLELMKEWDWGKNNKLGFYPDKLTCGSKKKVWWKCGKGHEWDASISHRNNARGCPFCSRRKVLKGYNDLQTLNPTLAREWSYERNDGLTPVEVALNSNKKVWWKCRKGHEWEATISHRSNGCGCPFCSGRYAIKGENDLQTINPNLASEWDYEKNGQLSPADVLPNSAQKVWWKCREGHEWKGEIGYRNKGHGCPYCFGRKVLKGYNDLQTINSTLSMEWNYEKNTNLIPTQISVGSKKKVWWKCSKGHEWQATIANRNKGSNCPYCSGRYAIKGINDLQTVNPNLAKEWDYEKNGQLSPADVLPNSAQKVWWKCSKGHEWQAKIQPRHKGVGCPVCVSELHKSFPECALVYYLKKYGIEVINSYKKKGYELDVYIPSKKIAVEYDGYFWHKNKTQKDLEKNLKCKKDGIKLYRIREGLLSLNDISIDYVIPKSQKNLDKAIENIVSEIAETKVDVDLIRDVIYIEKLRNFTEKENSFLFLNPQIAKEWNYEKNGNLKPENVTANSGKKVWWKCEKGHEWQTIIKNRNKGHGCPCCVGQKAIKGENDLQTINLGLANEWNYEKNNGLTPADFMPNSNKKVWWKCENEHEWNAKISARNKGRGCPYCSNKKVLVGYNDLQTLNPELAKEWNDDLNVDLKPTDFTIHSGEKVWWKCDKGHEWQARIYSRSSGCGCPVCAKEKRTKK